jgi:hypothetical protein
MKMAELNLKELIDERVRNTMLVFELLAHVAPDPAHPNEVSEILGIPERECLRIMASLAKDEWIRETEEGFQTLSQKVSRIGTVTHRVLDSYFSDQGEPIPRRRLPDGTWAAV